MTRPRLSPGEILSAAAGIALALSTLLPWFEKETTGRFLAGGPSAATANESAWAAVPIFAVLVVLVAAVPVVLVVRRLRTEAPIRPPVLLALGAVAVTLVLGAAATKLGAAGIAGADTVQVSTTAAAGLVIGALTALLIPAGGVLAMWGAGGVTTRPSGPG